MWFEKTEHSDQNDFIVETAESAIRNPHLFAGKLPTNQA